MGRGVLHIDDVGGDDEIEGGLNGFDLGGVVPVELGNLGGFGKGGAVPLEVAAEGGENGGDVGEDDVEAEGGEAEAGGATPGAELNGALSGEVEEMRVRVWGGIGGGRGEKGEPAVDEFNEDKGAGPDGGADVDGAVVLLEGEGGAPHGEFDHRRVGKLHCIFVAGRTGGPALTF